jgi:hypothetical protein
MTTYEFTVVIQCSPELTEEIADRLYEAGCDDGKPATRDGVLSIDFNRRGSSLQGAIASAIRDVQSTGLTVDRVVIEAASLPRGSTAESMVDPHARRFSIVELLAGVAALAIGFAWPFMLPAVAALFLIRAGVGLAQTVLIVLLGFPVVVWLYDWLLRFLR